MKEYVRNSDKCRRSLLMAPFLTNGNMELIQNEDQQQFIHSHACCDVCAKSCTCQCSCNQDVCSCDATCNSISYYSPMEILATECNSTVKVCINSGSSYGKGSPLCKEVRKCVRDELFQYRAKLAHDIPDEHLLTGIDIATGFSVTLIEDIVDNIWTIDCIEIVKNFLVFFFSEEHALQSWLIISSVKERLLHMQDTYSVHNDDWSLEDCSSSSSKHSSTDEHSPAAEHSSCDESDDSDIFMRYRICNIIKDSDSSDSD